MYFSNDPKRRADYRMGLEWIRELIRKGKGSGDDSSQSVGKVDINGKDISKHEHANSPPCQI